VNSTQLNLTQPLRSIDPLWLSRSSLAVAPDLLGCLLVRQFSDGSLIRGMIVETEAYTADDPAMHAYRRRTKRNSIMFGVAGMTYVYLIYGMYHCLNVVTDVEGVPSAVLIRALQFDTLPETIALTKPVKLAKIAAGPGKLCRVLEIDLSFTAQPLHPGEPLWLEHRSETFQQEVEAGTIAITQTTRVGLTQGIDLPWRWYITGNPAVSKI
jgi:DNA-3-methyladenine glycosylase